MSKRDFQALARALHRACPLSVENFEDAHVHAYVVQQWRECYSAVAYACAGCSSNRRGPRERA